VAFVSYHGNLYFGFRVYAVNVIVGLRSGSSVTSGRVSAVATTHVGGGLSSGLALGHGGGSFPRCHGVGLARQDASLYVDWHYNVRATHGCGSGPDDLECNVDVTTRGV